MVQYCIEENLSSAQVASQVDQQNNHPSRGKSNGRGDTREELSRSG